MEALQYRELVRRYLNNTATREELEVFFHLLQQGKLDAYLEELSQEEDGERAVLPLQHKKGLVIRMRHVWYTAAASVVLLFLTGIFLFRDHKQNRATDSLVLSVPQARPGSKKAVLLLSDGRKLDLSSLHQQIADGSATVIPQADKLVYRAGEADAETRFNTVTTPLGGEYQVTLPDGSNVWLNAGTSLRYPTAFAGPERRVELSGEAYFEVAKNRKQPFVVQSEGAEIKVLGTHFNVMAYADEDVLKTTLTEGAVVLRKSGREEKLAPGEGGSIARGSDRIDVAAANVDEDLAWKNGLFHFQRTELRVIMKQIARWYDLDVQYAGRVPDKRFVGRISRNTNLSDVLDVLRLSDVKFSMTGRTLVVQE